MALVLLVIPTSVLAVMVGVLATHLGSEIAAIDAHLGSRPS